MHRRELDSVKGVIFDLDGTLYRMEWFFRPLLFALLFPHSRRLLRLMSARSRFAGVDMGSRDALLDTLCTAIADAEKTTPDAIRRWILDRFYPAFVASMPLQRYGRPRIRGTLRLLHDRGVRLAVLSDFHAVTERLGKLRLPLDCFDTIASCEESGALKPAERPFLHIASMWNIAPSSVLVVGDRDDTDGEAARKAGMRFLLMGDRRHNRSASGTAYRWKEARTMLMTLGNSA